MERSLLRTQHGSLSWLCFLRGEQAHFSCEAGSWKPHISLSRKTGVLLSFQFPGCLQLAGFRSRASFSWSICEIQICIRGFGCGLGTCISSRRCSCSRALETVPRHIVTWFGYHPTALFNCIQIKGYVMMTWTVLSKRTKIIEKPSILHSITVI